MPNCWARDGVRRVRKGRRVVSFIVAELGDYTLTFDLAENYVALTKNDWTLKEGRRHLILIESYSIAVHLARGMRRRRLVGMCRPLLCNSVKPHDDHIP